MNLSPNDDDTLPHAPTSPGRRLSAAEWGAKSSIGLVRKANEDSWGQQNSNLFVVADGMGGSAGGARASAVAVAEFLSADSRTGWIQAMQLINERVRSLCDEDGFPSAGTTLVGLIFDQERCTYVSIGDSRIYRLSNGGIALLTEDHNVGNLRAEAGLDPHEPDARGKPAALTAYLGNPDGEQRIDIGTIALQPGDRVLLCSDGVHGQLSEDGIANLLAAQTCRLAAETLVNAADKAGGRDNATAIVVEIADENE